MRQYDIAISEEAQDDLRNLSEAISLEYRAPATAIRYLRGLYAEMQKLSTYAESFPLQTQPSLLKYGHYVRRVNYKRMAIFYTVHDSTVYIHRIVAASLINEL